MKDPKGWGQDSGDKSFTHKYEDWNLDPQNSGKTREGADLKPQHSGDGYLD